MSTLKKLLFISSLLLNILVNVNIYLDHYSHIFFLLWLISLLFFLLAGFKNYHFSFKKIDWHFVTILIFVGIFPLGIRTLLFNLNRIHGDDIIGAYLVDTMKLSKFNFFSGFPQDMNEWESQFAPPFFLLQKIFFSIFDANLLNVKLSIFPYISIVSIMLFLITQELFGRKTAFMTVFIYSYLAINLYLETVGLWVVSGSAVFLVFFYFLIKSVKNNKTLYAIFTGIACGASYLFYFTAYIAFVVMGLVFFFYWLRLKNNIIIRNFFIGTFACLLVVSPFATYSVKFNNYLFQRADQVALLTGSWSSVPREIASGKNPFTFIRESVQTSILSFSQNDIGGHGGVNFGHLALFDQFTRYLLLFGFLVAVYLLLKEKRAELLLFFLVIVLSFFTMVFSIPPPSYHRFALALPFLCIFISLPFYLLFNIKKLPLLLRAVSTCLIFAFFVTINQSYFFRAVVKEKYYEPLKVSEYINERFPNRNLYVAAYPGYGFEKTYYFSRGKSAKKIEVGYHDGYLQNFNRKEKYVYIILFPDVFNERFKGADPKGMIINLSQGFSLFVN